MKKTMILLAALLLALGLCSCGIQKEFTEMGFGFEAEGEGVITYFSDGLASETGGFTFYNLSEEPVNVHINACDGSDKILIEDLEAGPCWQRVEKNTEYVIGFSTDAEPGTEMKIKIIDGDEMK